MPASNGSQIVEDRVDLYGDPVTNMQKIAAMWSVIVGFEVTPRDACMMMICLKIVRENHLHQQDNLDDIEGYTDIARQVAQKEGLAG